MSSSSRRSTPPPRASHSLLNPARPTPPPGADQRIAALEQEVRAKDEYLQTTLEEMETANEELKSANEEMQSVNEELQSTNEELETSKEELQSVNEELSTVNAELQTKVNDLSRVNNDMNNLLAGSGVGTIFVDHQLRITRFTPAATQLINLIQTDVGRPVGHIASNLVGYGSLVEDVKAVLDTLTSCEREVQSTAGGWYLMRIRPYRTLENVIEGAVVTFLDITDQKAIERELLVSEASSVAILESLREAVLFVTPDGTVARMNAAALELLRLTVEDMADPARLSDAMRNADGMPLGADENPVAVALRTGEPVHDVRLTIGRPDGSTVPVVVNAEPVRDIHGGTLGAVASFFFVTAPPTCHDSQPAT